jgi:hypothetical protein
MSIIFDPTNKRIVLDKASVTATEIFSRWEDWAAMADNAKYGIVIRQVGGDDLGGGLSIPPYYFLQGAWRVRPMEADHDLTITGNLFVDGGGTPVVRTLGPYQVNVNYTVPVQAQGISTTGSSGPTAADIATAVRTELSPELGKIDAQVDGLTPNQLTMLIEMYELLGLDPSKPLTVTQTARSAGSISQIISSNDTQTVVSRV